MVWHATHMTAPHLINKNMRKLVCQRVCHFDNVRQFQCLANTVKNDKNSGSHFLASSVHIKIDFAGDSVGFKYTEALELFIIYYKLMNKIE